MEWNDGWIHDKHGRRTEPCLEYVRMVRDSTDSYLTVKLQKQIPLSEMELVEAEWEHMAHLFYPGFELLFFSGVNPDED